VLLQGTARAPEDARLHARLAQELLEVGDGAAALRAASASVVIDARLPEALRVKLFAEEMVKDRIDGAGYSGIQALVGVEPRVALTQWDALVKAYPSSALVLAGRARAHELTGNEAAAGADLEAAQRMGVNVEVDAALGLLRLRAGHPAEAVPLLALAWEARSWDVSLGLALSRALETSGQSAGALELLSGLAATQPFDLRVGRTFAQALIDRGLNEEAYTFIRNRLARVPDPQLGIALIAAAMATGRNAEAAKMVDDIARQTDNTALLEAAARLRGQ
jgi:predicted Zn-dependent protease